MGERSFSLDEVFDILEKNYILCERNNREFRNKMVKLVNAFKNTRNFKGILQSPSRTSEDWTFIFRVELGRDERRIKRIEDTYEKVKSKYQYTLNNII